MDPVIGTGCRTRELLQVVEMFSIHMHSGGGGYMGLQLCQHLLTRPLTIDELFTSK